MHVKQGVPWLCCNTLRMTTYHQSEEYNTISKLLVMVSSGIPSLHTCMHIKMAYGVHMNSMTVHCLDIPWQLCAAVVLMVTFGPGQLVHFVAQKKHSTSINWQLNLYSVIFKKNIKHLNCRSSRVTNEQKTFWQTWELFTRLPELIY